jgi:hypothetical protein
MYYIVHTKGPFIGVLGIIYAMLAIGILGFVVWALVNHMVHRQNVEVTFAESTKRRTTKRGKKKRRMEKTPNGTKGRMEKKLNGKNINGTKGRMVQNVDWKKHRMEKTPNGTKCRMEKRRMGQNVE